MKVLAGFLMMLLPEGLSASVKSDSIQSRHRGKFKAEAYLDLYYGVSSNTSRRGHIPYFVSSARINKLESNKAFISLRYESGRFRAAFIPAIGTYMTDNYASEKGIAKHLVEANAGFRLGQSKEVWLDAGVMESPFTNESAISGNQWMYTRSFAPEYVPYYLTGVRLSMPLSDKVGMRVWLLNGWQQIKDQNKSGALALGFDWKPHEMVDVVYNTFLGDEQSAARPEFRTRYFHDLYVTWRPRKHFRIASCFYYGIQQRSGNSSASWYQFNVTARQRLSEGIQLNVRAEYFHDPQMVMISALNGDRFRSASIGSCLDVRLIHKTILRLDVRRFISPDAVFPVETGGFTKGETRLFLNLTARI